MTHQEEVEEESWQQSQPGTTGNPQQQQTPQEQQYSGQYAQQPPQYQQARRGIADTFTSDGMLIGGVIIGVILLLIAGILSGTVFFIKDDPDLARSLYGVSTIFLNIGALMFVMFLTVTAVFKKELDKYVRFGLLVVVALVLYALISSGSGISSLLSFSQYT
ncbi:MAG: hypothetical protein ACQESD_01305 [Thermoplasmatota archaeon]